MVSPSAAVTVTVRVFSPATRPKSPSTEKVASASVVSTSTSTSVTPGSRSTTSPSATSLPSTWNTANEVSLDSSTSRVTKYSSRLFPSAEVTTTLSRFSPVTKPESPSMVKLAFGSRVSTTTSTSVVPASS